LIFFLSYCIFFSKIGDATEECLNKTYLRASNSQEKQQKFNIKNNETDFTVNYNLKLPTNLTCSHCVLQWHWVTGNFDI
jgi:hypothetical protein